MIDSTYVVAYLGAPIILLHTSALGHVLLRPPWSAVFRWTAPALLCIVIATIVLDPRFIRLSVGLLVPHMQWIITWILYRRFIARHGRLPRDVFLKAYRIENPGPDSALLFVGLVLMTVVPTALILASGKLQDLLR